MTSTKSSRDIKVVFGADFHIGNNKVSALESHLNLKDFFYPELLDSQILFLGGDFFHRFLKLDEMASLESISIVKELIDLAKKHKFMVRVLRGTFSHDRLQNAVFKSVLANNTDVDLVCVDTISLEYIQKYDLKILYIPDNLPYKSKDEVMKFIRNLLSTYGWDKVDFIIGHGYFEHVFPVGVPHPPIVFEYDDFKDMVNYYVLMGHVHTSSIYKNIIYSGSFERFAHGEEEKKGFYTLYRTNGNWTYNFIENKDTPLFYTIELTTGDVDELSSSIDSFIEKMYPTKSGYLRISHPNTDLKQVLLQLVKDKYKDIIVTTKQPKQEVEYRKIIREFQTCTSINPTKENLASLTLEYLKQYDLSTDITEDDIKSVLQL